jgi:AcrR family transcriptional regulator
VYVVHVSTPDRPTSPPRRRSPLNRSAVLAAAVHLADREGAEAVSMRRLAETLGVVPMALYKHVADKDDLLAGMVDQVIAEFTAGPSTTIDTLESVGAETDSWQGQVRRLLWAARRVVAAHPWARRAIETRSVRTAAVFGHMDRLTRILLDGGLSADLAHGAPPGRPRVRRGLRVRLPSTRRSRRCSSVTTKVWSPRSSSSTTPARCSCSVGWTTRHWPAH